MEVNGARNVKSNVQVDMNKTSDPVQKLFLRWLGRTVPPTHFFPNFWNCAKRVELGKLILGLQDDITR